MTLHKRNDIIEIVGIYPNRVERRDLWNRLNCCMHYIYNEGEENVMTNIMECTQRKIDDTVELNLDKETIKVDEKNQIIYFKFGCDENGVMEYKDLGFKDVPKTPKSIVAYLFNKDFYTTVIGIDEDEYGDQVVHFSRKKYLQEQIDCIKVDDIYDCKIVSIAPFGLFAEIADGVVCMIHCSEASKSTIRDLNTCFKVGDNIKVKIISKLFQNGKWKINASRKQADKGIDPMLGTVLPVTITGIAGYDAYFCEVTPSQKGILHAPVSEKFAIGDKTYGYLIEHADEGFVLRAY